MAEKFASSCKQSIISDMNTEPIKSEADYDAALKEIENLFEAEPNTPGGDRLEVLMDLVEAYEDKHYAVPAPDPIESTLTEETR